jgi:hypothetical protein
MKRLLVAVVLTGAWTMGRAELPVAQFAGAQLSMAEAALEHAAKALQVQDYSLARRLAAQAGLDARLAWGMTNSSALRRAAVEVNRRAERLRWRGLAATGGATLIRP